MKPRSWDAASLSRGSDQRQLPLNAPSLETCLASQMAYYLSACSIFGHLVSGEMTAHINAPNHFWKDRDPGKFAFVRSWSAGRSNWTNCCSLRDSTVATRCTVRQTVGLLTPNVSAISSWNTPAGNIRRPHLHERRKPSPMHKLILILLRTHQLARECLLV